MEVRLGKEKVVNVELWKAKAKKDFIKLFRLKGEKVTDKDIIDTLVTPYLSDNSFYISGDEYQQILIKLREESISSEINFEVKCESCENNNKIQLSLENISKYQPNKYEIEMNDVVWKDIKEKNSLKDMIKKYKDEPPKIIEMLLHISSIKGVIIESFDQILKIYEELSLKEAETLEDTFEEVRSKIQFKSNIKCKECDFEKEYDFDVIPTFYDPLLPKGI